MANNSSLWDELSQAFQEIKTIGLVPEDVSSLDTPNYHMMQGSGSVWSGCSWHGSDNSDEEVNRQVSYLRASPRARCTV